MAANTSTSPVKYTEMTWATPLDGGQAHGGLDRNVDDSARINGPRPRS